MCSQEADKLQEVKKLQHNLLNSPLQCFGCHSNCSPDFCKTVQQQQQHQQQQSNNQVSTAETALVGNTEEDTTTDNAINDTTSGMRL